MQSIDTWLGGNRDYEEGVRLYLAHGRNVNLKRLFTSRKPNAALQEKLAYELGKLGSPARQAAPAQATDAVDVRPPQPELPPSAEPAQDQPNRDNEALKAIAAELGVSDQEDLLAVLKSRLHGQRAKLSNTLADYAIHDNEGRAKVVAEIVSLTEQMNEIRITQEGRAPLAVAAKPLKELPSAVGDLYGERNNTRSNLSKAKAKLSQSEQGTEKHAKYKAKVEALEKRLEEIERRINGY